MANTSNFLAPTASVNTSTGRIVGRAFRSGEFYGGVLASNTDGTPFSDDVMVGTDGDDNIYGGRDGSDDIFGEAGDDVIGYGAGDACIDAGMGNDLVYAVDPTAQRGGNNEISLGAGIDNFYATTIGETNRITGSDDNLIGISNGNNDTVITSSGNDFVYTTIPGFPGAPVIFPSDNVLALGEGENIVYAEFGNYDITTGSGRDIIGLGSGRDTVNAGDGDNVVYTANFQANTGNKDILTGAGNDYIETSFGDDLIDGGGGLNTLFGRSGSDTFTVRTGAYNFIGDFEIGIDDIKLEGLAFSSLSFFQGTGSVANDAFVFVGSEAIAQIANVQVTDLNNSSSFV